MSARNRSRKPEIKPLPAPEQKTKRKRVGKQTGYLPPAFIGDEDEEALTLAETEERSGEDFDDPAVEEDEEFSLALETSEEDEVLFREPGERDTLTILWIWTGTSAVWCRPSHLAKESLKRLDNLRRIVNAAYSALSDPGRSPFAAVDPAKLLGSELRMLEGLFTNEYLSGLLDPEKDSVRFSRDLARLGIYHPGKRHSFPLGMICPARGKKPSKGYLPPNLERLWLFGETGKRGILEVDWKNDRSWIVDSYAGMIHFLNSTLGNTPGYEAPFASSGEKTLQYKRVRDWNRWLKEAAEWEKQ